MTLEDTVTREVNVQEILKKSIILLTGVTRGKEWVRVCISGDNKKRKSNYPNRAFDYDLINLAREAGCKVITCGSTTPDEDNNE